MKYQTRKAAIDAIVIHEARKVIPEETSPSVSVAIEQAMVALKVSLVCVKGTFDMHSKLTHTMFFCCT